MDVRRRSRTVAAAELLIAERGIEAVTVRDVARKAGTTTRAVYVPFGSKEQLLEALARRGFELLMSGIAAVPPSRDPARDLVNRSVKGFRAFALEHPESGPSREAQRASGSWRRQVRMTGPPRRPTQVRGQRQRRPREGAHERASRTATP